LAMRNKVAHHGCDHAAALKHAAERAERDGVWTPQERAEVLALIDRNYGLWELHAFVGDLGDQLERIPDECPNRPLRAMMQDVSRVCETIDERVRPLAVKLGLREAA
jgi:hypothetical protein